MDKELDILTGCDRGLCKEAVGRQDRQLNTYDWLADVPGNVDDTDLVEVQFKHTRKGYYHNVNKLDLKKGDIVAVEANPGHDIGVVTLTGRLVKLQIKKANLKSADDIKRVYRIARDSDMEKYREAKSREHATMIESRQIAKGLGLDMKIGDVEYQGDCNKAIFYYTDQRPGCHLPCAHRDEADWCSSGGWSYWWYGALRTRVVLCHMDEKFRVSRHIVSTLPRHLTQPTEVSGHVCKAEVLSELRSGQLRGGKQKAACKGYTVADTKCRLLLFQGRYSGRTYHLLY